MRVRVGLLVSLPVPVREPVRELVREPVRAVLVRAVLLVRVQPPP